MAKTHHRDTEDTKFHEYLFDSVFSVSPWFVLLLLIGFSAWSDKKNTQNQDKKQPLSREATAVLQKLSKLGDRFLIAHQDATSYGVKWNYSVDFILMNKLIREAPETVFGREWAAITH